MLLAVLTITACGEKKESEEKIVKEEILEGIVDDYKFTVTDEVTDRVRIQMNNGDIMLVVLSNSQTPITIQNFKNHVQKGTYNGLIFHRVIENFIIQGGDPTGTGYGDNSIPTIKGEFASNGVENNLKHKLGVLSMARTNDPNSASGQFFICSASCSHLDGAYAAFGRVTDDLSIANVLDISHVQTTNIGYGFADFPVEPITIKTIVRNF